jgi:hypothetical protein
LAFFALMDDAEAWRLDGTVARPAPRVRNVTAVELGKI